MPVLVNSFDQLSKPPTVQGGSYYVDGHRVVVATHALPGIWWISDLSGDNIVLSPASAPYYCTVPYVGVSKGRRVP